MEHKTYHGRPVIWSPQPRQAAFMARTEDEALYGGAAGGGKSDALIIEALRQVHIPHYRALILRKTYPQLSELIDKTMRYYKPVFPKARYNGSSHCWTFPSGAKIYFGSLNHTQDKYNYQGKAFDFIGVDELTHFTWDEYSYVMSRNRPSGPGTRVYIRATANPGGVGHGWVKARFISPAPAGTRMVQMVKVKAPDGEEITRRRTRIFIPSTIFDNPALLKNDPGYIGTLASLPEAEKQALLYGNWDSFSGQVFTEWRNDPNHYKDQRWTHVIEPFPIPEHWKIWRGYDFGFSKPFSVGWYAADERGRLYRIKELYGCTGTPNEGLRKDPMEQARMIREAEENDPLLKGRVILGVADPAIFDESRGESIADMQEKSPNFLHWIYDNKSDVITPVGEKLTAEQWLDRYQWGRYTKMIVGGGIINGSVALVFDDEVERYRKAGCDFSACVTDEDYLAAIEAFEDDPPMADAGVSDQTRIADALEDMVALSLPDDTTNTTEE